MADGMEGGSFRKSGIPQLLLSLGGKGRVTVCDNHLQVISFLNRNKSVVVAILSILMQFTKLGEWLLFSQIFGAVSLAHILHGGQQLGWITERYRIPYSIDAQEILSVSPKTNGFIFSNKPWPWCAIDPTKA